MIGDTIVALSSAPGPAARAVLRLSGPAAREAAARVFAPAPPAERAQVDGHVTVRGHRLPAFALSMPAPRSFTGEDVVELHVPGSPLLVQLLLEQLLRDGEARGVREALPGEFTARASQNQKLDAMQVEGLLVLLHAADQRAAAAGVQWLTGAFTRAVHELRSALQDALALLEVGLDFDDGEAGAVPAAAWSATLPGLTTRLAALADGLPAAAPGGEVLLLGRANAGKSSLANALAGRDEVLVADVPGTTRDLLRVPLGDGAVLWDAPGDLDDPVAADRAALALRERLSGRAAALLVVLDASDPVVPEAALCSPVPWFGVVWTKCDLVSAPPALPAAVAARLPSPERLYATSSASGLGLDALRRDLERTGRSATVDAGGPLRQALAAAGDAVARAIAAEPLGPELVAVELQAALRCLDGIAGSHSPEHLLDRIYRGFCLGK